MTTLLSDIEHSSEFLETDTSNHGIEVKFAVGADSFTENNARFTREEIRAFQTDDAMAGGMVGVILGIAFTVLLGLVTGVNIWTSFVAYR